MKKIIALLMVLFMFSGITKSQITFTVKPGLNLNGANFGYKKKNLEPFIGLQFVNLTSEYKNNDPNYPEDDKTKLHVYMPFIGCKLFLSDNESLKTSINASIFKPVIFGKRTINGEEDDSFKENIKGLHIWGGEIGFETEYFFKEFFSIGGEFGFRYGFYKRETDSNNGYSYTDALKMNMTYISMSLNFYFPGKKN